MVLKLPNGQLSVTVDPSQLRTMASEKADPIASRYHVPFTEQYPLSPSCTVQAPLYKCDCGCRESILVSIYTSEHKASALL